MTSAALCPQCGSSLLQDFGLATCPACGSVLLIDMEGQAKFADQGVPEVSEPILAERPAELEYEEIVPGHFAAAELLADEAKPQTPKEAFFEIQEFANSDVGAGPLAYVLSIEGIDIGRDRDRLKEILSDSKLKLDFGELMKSIKNGRLEISNLNPVKATVLVQNFADTGLRVSWRQNAFGS